ncbi:hypothetical protein DV515_00009989 [Chloebia gouldiae]|uniref:Uncharacterized protein n=1 Tax=Chloebia gouldiae TaxID=44316 RepID=A0A3L8SAX1_CHLGU|nr:hypothetical protein DV515_00009989 [Chloebia gouldiae]
MELLWRERLSWQENGIGKEIWGRAQGQSSSVKKGTRRERRRSGERLALTLTARSSALEHRPAPLRSAASTEHIPASAPAETLRKQPVTATNPHHPAVLPQLRKGQALG